MLHLVKLNNGEASARGALAALVLTRPLFLEGQESQVSSLTRVPLTSTVYTPEALEGDEAVCCKHSPPMKSNQWATAGAPADFLERKMPAMSKVCIGVPQEAELSLITHSVCDLGWHHLHSQQLRPYGGSQRTS